MQVTPQRYATLFSTPLQAIPFSSWLNLFFARITNLLILSSQRPVTEINEILANVSWRFLQIRGYLNEKHDPTPWGLALLSALQACPAPLDTSPREYEEAVFLGIELVRLGALNGKDVLPGTPTGATMSDADKKYIALISRAATIGKLRHQPIGYSGPLNRQTLAFRSQISAVRKTLRDLIEVVYVNMLLNGDVDRSLAIPYGRVSLELPFINDNDCGLGLAVRTYLETLHLTDYVDPTKEEVRKEVKEKGQKWFNYIDSFSGSLDTGFRIWEAIYEGVRAAGEGGMVTKDEMKEWEAAEKWLTDRR